MWTRLCAWQYCARCACTASQEDWWHSTWTGRHELWAAVFLEYILTKYRGDNFSPRNAIPVGRGGTRLTNQNPRLPSHIASQSHLTNTYVYYMEAVSTERKRGSPRRWFFVILGKNRTVLPTAFWHMFSGFCYVVFNSLLFNLKVFNAYTLFPDPYCFEITN
jgi:hypothetical protein